MSPSQPLTLHVRALVLDMDDTINQTTVAMRVALRTAAVGLWPQVPEERLHAAVERYAFDGAGWFQRFSSGQIDFETMRRGRLADMAAQLDNQLSDQQYESFEESYRAVFIDSCRAFDDALRLLDRARAAQVPVAVLSNSAHHMTRRKIHRIGLDDRFTAVLCADQLGAGKPDPGAYLAACRAIGHEPGEVGYVDDLFRDAHGGAQAGLKAVWLDRIGEDGTPDSEHQVRSGDQAVPMIGGLDQLDVRLP
ncbi:HAD family hydrolase [Propionibacterium freudenreichii]|uniref:HAD family hydrolase n=1 Tax=Propionibacterium freudenreichii TaxID=1744 RepID=UPI0005A5C758|nr:HAD family hydrolase [Propionibacterium freudenreichii]MDK9651380.1 HAD family hydrolase [Propionibacterium freudenreichii]MDK9664788.1 HAD family hydrolase [Propionibacterium freudenreichii]CEI29728.1 hydrolase, haloacid dehalogenase-like hydrolase [Propionibacterium freudenreichii]